MISTKSMIIRTVSFASLSIASLSVASQRTAHKLHDQPALGRPVSAVSGTALYPPYAVLVWWARYGRQAPRLFDEAGAIVIAGQVLATIIAILVGGLTASKRMSTTYGSARWATLAEVRMAGLFASDGIILGVLAGRYLRHAGSDHVLLIAPTRSGKGVGVVVPTLLTWTGSAVIHDLKGEQWALTSGWRSCFSHCLLFDPTDVRSARFNPLLEVRRGEYEVRDVQNIADILVDPEGRLEQRSHWEKTSHSLLVGAILHILYVGNDKTLAAVASLLSRVDQPFTTTLEGMLAANHLGEGDSQQVHPVVAACARELLDKSPNERSGIVSTAISFLSLYRDPVVARVTAACDWRIADLVDPARPASLYLVVPPSDVTRTRPLIRLLLNQICRRLTERLPAGREPKLLLMLDEFPALGRLDFFETSLAFLAGYGIRAVLVAQSMNQLAKAYGETNAIVDNCSVRVAFATNDDRTAKRLSDMLGAATEQRTMRNFSGPRSSLWLPHTSVSHQETPRPLLTPGEIIQLPSHETLIQLSGLPPIRARKVRYFEDRALHRRRLAPPVLSDQAYGDRPAPKDHDWPVEAARSVVPINVPSVSPRGPASGGVHIPAATGVMDLAEGPSLEAGGFLS